MANGNTPTPQIPSSLAALTSATDQQLKDVLGLLGPDFKQRLSSILTPPTLTGGEPVALAEPVVVTSVSTEPVAASNASSEPAPSAPPAPFPEQQKVLTGPEFGFSPPPSFEAVPPDFVLYDPDRAQGRSILGILHGSIELPKQQSAGRALVITCMEPTLVVDNSGRLFESTIGQDIIVEATFWLVCLVRRAMHKEKVGEVWLRPLRKLLCAGGDYQYEWEIRNGRLHDRETFRQMVQKRVA